MYQGRLYFFFQGMAKWNMDSNRAENYKLICQAGWALSLYGSRSSIKDVR